MQITVDRSIVFEAGVEDADEAELSVAICSSLKSKLSSNSSRTESEVSMMSRGSSETTSEGS